MPQEGFKRKLTAILSADAVGYSRLMREDEEATVRDIAAHRVLISEIVQQHNGRVIDSPGDNILAEFASVVDAVNGAIKIQEEIKRSNADTPKDRRMEFRIGINLGDVIEEEERIYGDGVNIAARVEGLALADGICISGTVYEHIKDKLSLGYHYLGEQNVKNISEPVRVYRLLTDPADAGKMIGYKKPKSKKLKWISSGAIALIVLMVGTFTIWNYYLRPSFEPASVEKMAFPLPEKPSIAVLPLENLSGDKEQDYLVDGLTENIIAALSKVPEMFVIARNSTFTYKGKAVKVQQVAEELGVQYVLEGSVQKSAEKLRVTVQLIDSLKGHHVWSEKYDRKIDDLFSVQDDITLNIAIAMQVKLTEGEQARVRHLTDNLEAWGIAVKAHNLFETYRKENNSKARELFKRAIELDPNYVYAWSYLGWTYWIDGVYYSAHYDRNERFKHAAEIALKALSIDNKSSDANALLSAVYMSQKMYDDAVNAGKRTINLDPNSSENHAIVAITMQNVGDFETAITLLKQAMRLNPHYPVWYLARLGMCYRMIERYEESAAALENSLERMKKSGTGQERGYLYLATTYSMMGRVAEAKSLVSEALEINPKMTIELWRKRFQYKDPEHTERILNALRLAGLPE